MSPIEAGTYLAAVAAGGGWRRVKGNNALKSRVGKSCFSAAPTTEKHSGKPLQKGCVFGKSVLFPYIIIVTYKGYFFNVFSPDFAIFLNFSSAMSPYIAKTPFWGIFEGKKQPFFIQMG